MEDRKKANLINFVKDFHRDYPATWRTASGEKYPSFHGCHLVTKVESEQIILPEMLEILGKASTK